MEIWNSPYHGEDIREVHGIALPQDYMDFLRLHNGGEVNNLKRKPKPWVLKFPSWKLVFFSMEDILSDKYYPQKKPYGKTYGSVQNTPSEVPIRTSIHRPGQRAWEPIGVMHRISTSFSLIRM